MKIIISEKYHQARLDRFLREYFGIPQSLASKLVRQKKVKVNGKRAEISTVLNVNDALSLYYFLEKKNPSVPNVAKSMLAGFQTWVLHEDDELLIINKPAGVASQGGPGVLTSVDVLAKAYFAEARVTHRLDKATSGVMILAKSKPVARQVTQMFAAGLVQKTYHAVVLSSNVTKKTGIIETNIVKMPNAHKMAVLEGTSAVTKYKILQQNAQHALLEVLPKTGKMHQIRVHLSYLKMPILGDEKYGGTSAARMFLHAHSVVLNGRVFVAPMPTEFTNLGFLKK